MGRYFFGLDGGSSKTHAALYDAESGALTPFAFGQSNYENMPGGYADLAAYMKDMAAAITEASGVRPADIDNAVFGMSGVDTLTQHGEISKIITDAGFKEYILCNDAFLGVKAGAACGFGVSCVNGSGYSVAGIGPDGSMLQIGGMGHLTGDAGGAYWVVPKAVAYAYGQIYKGYPPSVLLELFMRELNINNKNDFGEALHKRICESHRAFTFAAVKLVFEASAQHDVAARNILAEAGRSYGESVAGILRALDFKNNEPEIILTGSLFQKQPESQMVKSMEHYLDKHYGRPHTLRILDAPPVLGALVWAVGNADNALREALKHKLMG